MIKKHHIYMLKNGRVSIAAVTSHNAKYIAAAIDDSVRSSPAPA
jgi:aspartate aminotransferase